MSKSAQLFRMATNEHICPFGLKSKDLLEREGYDVDDHLLASREQADELKKQYNVKTTPQTFIDNKRIGGYDDLRAFFNKPQAGQQGTSYTPVFAIFAVTFLLSIAFSYSLGAGLFSIGTVELFVALTMAVLAIQKLQDLYRFSNSFITYDLLAMKVVPYAYVYPFLEAFVGIGMVAGLTAYLVAPISLFIGTIGAVSVFKAVYVDKRELKCACVGGDSNVPLGFISLTENVFMIAAGIWMLVR
ncbi:glutaredoxin family protein [Pseudoalteromonas sp. A601]|uniref:MauE/DoxX family redox-associated membrane protein n=1 Tax=Pseudoalteromonas sp. A601 TaxID=1967839 RepID=UPI000B3C29C8|nr:MauE/DoxX family redox-associated membrane protein [Pseudoalteromonas sp. A601]OUS68653.1 glutaredoxin family protein [Pseudoalteromonas sp. A601]